MKNLIKIILGLSTVAFIPAAAHAEGCAGYPYTAGEIEITNTPTGIKIFATGVATVDIDDMGEVLDATTEATMKAKARISKFFTEEIKSDTEINTVITKSIKLVNGKKAVTKDSVIKTLKRISSNSSKLLRGVVKLAECYTKGKIVMVSVGLKPETIVAAEGANKLIDDSINRKPTTNNNNVGTKRVGNSGSSGSSTRGPDSYSRGINKLKKF